MDDLISRQAAIEALSTMQGIVAENGVRKGISLAWQQIKDLPSAQPEPQWIPIKTRPMNDEERNYWSEHYGYDVEYEDTVMFDCKMPEDKQPVWVQSKCGYVYEDVCENDDGMIGLEGNGDWNDIVAWMPKYVPEPWRGEE